MFPCRYSNQGCPEKLNFSVDKPNIHERDCKFRNFFCPIVSRDLCDWVGSCTKLSEHCLDVHPTHFFENPFVLPRLDLTKPNLTNFLVPAFNFLFLVHIKICVASGKLFHSMRMFGKRELLDKFSYSLEIKGNGSKILKEGSVFSASVLTIQDATANCILFSSLLDLLGGKYGESQFTITIQTLIRNCLNCLRNLGNNIDLKFCEGCIGKLVECKFRDQECLFVDVNKNKCEKHEFYFCEYQTKCCLPYCEVNFVNGSFIEHLDSSISCRKTVKSNINSVVRVTLNSYSKHKYILFSKNNFGTIICEYNLFNYNFQLWLYTSLPSHELKNFKCSIELIDPQTKHIQTVAPHIIYDNFYDWYINARMDSFPSCQNHGIDIKINIDRA